MYGPCLPCGKCSRLQQRLQAATKAATKVVGSCEDCHIGCRLLQRLPHKLQAATKVACCCDGCNRACWLLRRLPQRLLQRVHATVMDAIELFWLREDAQRMQNSEGMQQRMAGSAKG
ncbi:hypothetical protein Tco_1293195 [Tanacetum coccineum]